MAEIQSQTQSYGGMEMGAVQAQGVTEVCHGWQSGLGIAHKNLPGSNSQKGKVEMGQNDLDQAEDLG